MVCDPTPCSVVFSILGGMPMRPSTLSIRYSRRALALLPADPMHVAELLTRIAAELALFAGVGFLLFGLNDLAVDLIYFARALVALANGLSALPANVRQLLRFKKHPGFMAILVPAWDELAVIAPMLRSTLNRLDYDNYRIFVGHYRNDPATAAAIASVPTSGSPGPGRSRRPDHESGLPQPSLRRADCVTNWIAAQREGHRASRRGGRRPPLRASDFRRPYRSRGGDPAAGAAAGRPNSRWISGHYCDEFAEAHIKELVVREAVGAAIPLAGVGCAIARRPLASLPPSMTDALRRVSLTEDYEMGLRIGASASRLCSCAFPPSRASAASSPAAAFSRDAWRCRSPKSALARRHRFSGWDRLGWSGGLGERWMRLRDRRGPFAALMIVRGIPLRIAVEPDLAGASLGSADRSPDRSVAPHPADDQRLPAGLARAHARGLHGIGLRVGRGAAFDAAHFRRQSHRRPRRLPRFPLHRGGRTPRWDKTQHMFPKEAVQ